MRALVVALAAGPTLAACALFETPPRHAPPPPPPPPQPQEQAAAPAPPPPKVVRIRVPTPVKCVPEDLGPPPVYPDTEQAMRSAGGAADRYQLLAAGRILRDERLQKLEDVVKKCRAAAAARPSPQ